MATCWVLVSNSARGAVYSTNTQLEKLEEVEQYAHPESRAKASEIYSDERGSVRGGLGGPHSAMEPHTEFHRIEATQFAHQIGGALRAGRVHNSFGSLIIVAPPRFLGLLRDELDTETARMVTDEIPHDWTSVTPARDLAERIREALPTLR